MTSAPTNAAPHHWHQLQAEEVVRLLDADLKAGLSGAEVRRRLEKFGPNIVRPRRGAPAWLKFLQQFNQPLVYILLLAGGVTAILGEWVDFSVILGVVVINAADLFVSSPAWIDIHMTRFFAAQAAGSPFAGGTFSAPVMAYEQAPWIGGILAIGSTTAVSMMIMSFKRLTRTG